MAYVATREEVTSSQIMSDALHIPEERKGRREQMRVANIMKRAGWEPIRLGAARGYKRPKDGVDAANSGPTRPVNVQQAPPRNDNGQRSTPGHKRTLTAEEITELLARSRASDNSAG
jgi:hypothetical protein